MIIAHGYCIEHAYCIEHGYCTWLFYLVIVWCVHEQPSVSIAGQTSPPCPLCSPSSPQWGVEQFDSTGDKGVFQSVYNLYHTS